MGGDPATIEIADGVPESVVKDRAREYFDGLSPGHDWHHVERVVAMSKRLAADTAEDDTTPPSIDRGVLVAAGWLHDIGRAKESRNEIDDHAAWGAVRARRILADVGLEPVRREAVAHCVRAHRYSNDVTPESIEAKLLCDADNLDATGAVGIARAFAYAGEHGDPLHDPDLPPSEDTTEVGATAFNHVHEKILDLEECMYTAAGRQVAADRQAYVEAFLDRFEREARGNDPR